MLSLSIQQHIIHILEVKGITVNKIASEPVSGGSINQTCKVIVNHTHHYFLKINNHDPHPDLFAKEKSGLEFLSVQNIINTPAVIDSSEVDDQQILLLQWIGTGLKTDLFWKQFGEQLALLHQCMQSHFGFHEDNYMGVFLQKNEKHDNWCNFFIEKRLLPQIQIAATHLRLSPKDVQAFHALFKKLDSIFDNEKPSLLHGDLWSGNFICNEKSEPVLIDPAVYFGHRSVDLGMTTLFGGFDLLFYDAYNYHFPFPKNYREQWDICNLYPLLIHLNLFGSSYLPDIRRIIERHQHT